MLGKVRQIEESQKTYFFLKIKTVQELAVGKKYC
jgi:hypothetical protein